MGLLQRALETYEYHVKHAENRDGVTPMAPVGHIVTRAELEITLDPDGQFVIVSAVFKDEAKIIIPVTEGSAGRTSAPCAHPLCEQVSYLLPENNVKYALYLEQLSGWASSEFSHPTLFPILRYVQSGTILQDLARNGLGLKNNPEGDKRLVRWRVLGSPVEECWLDTSLMDAYSRYTLAQVERQQNFCMVTGFDTGVATQHPKGIFSLNGNAKLISANDSSGFTYRGRFTEEWQAATVGYEASQKAHSALRWLIQQEGVIAGGRVILCWNPQGKTVIKVTRPCCKPEKIWHPVSYQKELCDVLTSRKSDFNVTDGVVVAAFDAATTGRLAVTYYNEFQAHDFLQRLHDWDLTCCWPDWRFGIQSPSLMQIVNCAFGTERTEKGTSKLVADDAVIRQQLQRLVACRIEKEPIGADIVKALANRASQPQAYENSVRETVLSTACAVIRKYRNDKFKEEWSMALEPEKQDRSYQFGRLLAVMEKVERDTYDAGESREPNAIRMQSVFCRRPMYVAKILDEQLEQAYFPRLKPGIRAWHKTILAQILDIISQYPAESWNLPLDDTYLMGYYLQRNALYTKKENNTEENEHEYAE